jgi:IS5 family transposase
MKKLSHCIEKHAKRYKALLQDRWHETDWTEAQTNQIIGRIDLVLNQLPTAIKQAHERIIGQRQIANRDKILSLYEPDAHVIVRGKAGNEVEFGHGLLLCEQLDGIIVDWQLFKDQPPSDSQLLQETVTRLEKDYGEIDSLCTDRGFYSRKNESFLQTHGIYDAMCPRSPNRLQARLQESFFCALQSRRGQTEARIGIFKNAFLGRPLRSKGFIHKQLRISWCVLTHNLWVIARMALADERSALKKAA